MTKSTRATLFIEAQDLPTKSFSILLEEPSFEIRRDAAKRMPSNPEAKAPFSLEQAMLAMSIKEYDGVPIPKDLKDPIDVIKNMMPKDLQCLLSIFIEAFTLTDDVADEAKRIAEQLMKSTAPVYVIEKSIMPTQKFSVSFRRPTANDEFEANRKYPGAAAQPGYSREEMIMSACITHIDGKLVEETKNSIDLLNEWDHIDAQFLLGVFLSVAYLDQEDRSKAVELGKKFRTRDKSSITSSTKDMKKVEPTPVVLKG
jgi:hypothetical protein